MVAQRVLVLLAKVRFLLGRQVKKQLHGVIGSMPDFGSGGGGSNPSGVYMEFVAQLVECQVVALVVMGSIPIKLPNASIAQWLCSSLVMSRSSVRILLEAPHKKGFSSGSFA